MKNPKTIRALFTMPGFVARARLAGVFGDQYARVIQLQRRKKQPSVLTVVTDAEGATTSKSAGSVIYLWRAGESTWNMSAGASSARGAAGCM